MSTIPAYAATADTIEVGDIISKFPDRDQTVVEVEKRLTATGSKVAICQTDDGEEFTLHADVILQRVNA